MSAPEKLPVLSDLFHRALLSSTPLFDAKRQTLGVRVLVHGLPAGRAPSEAIGSLVSMLAELDPLMVFVGVPDAPLDANLFAVDLPKNMVIEVPADFAADPERTALLQQLAAKGRRLAVSGLPSRQIPSEVLGCFEAALVPANLDRRLAPVPVGPSRRALRFYVTEAGSLAEADAAFGRGATGCVGWPTADEGMRRERPLQPAQSVVLELMRLLRDDAPAARIEAVLKRDTALSYRLLKLVNSASLGLAANVTSFQQAVMVLGYAKLQRWLVMLLAKSSTDPDVTPLVNYSIMRGLVLDYLGAEVDASLRDDLFVTGAFSLLDRITGTSFDRLFESVMLSSLATDAIARGDGQLGAFLWLMKGIERHDEAAIREQVERQFLTPMLLNTALLRALVDSYRLMKD
ncbi:MAG: HDOD domain-containing protein [Burkholderiaceae bacterium]|nr:HDOD domain-containing protein [Burkholderiaceae bacterium]